MRRFELVILLCWALSASLVRASESSVAAVSADENATGTLEDTFDWNTYAPKASEDGYADEGYESEVVGYRLRPTDQSTGFGETLELDESRKSVSDVSEVLSHTVGVQVKSMGGLGAYGAASVRGSTSSQVPVFLDGVQLNIGGFSSVNLGDFSLDTLESIEVYRGNAPLRLGTGGIGGAIILRTKALDDAISEYAASYGSWNTWRLMTLYAARAGKLDALVLVSGRHTDGDFRYYNRNGTSRNTDDDYFTNRTNNDHTAESTLLKLSRPFGPWTATLIEDFYYKEQGLAGIDHMVGQSDAGLTTLRNAFSLRFERELAKKTEFDFDLAHLLLYERYLDLSGSIGTGHQDHEYRTNGVSLSGLSVTEFSKKNITSARIAMRYEHFDEKRNQLPAEDQNGDSYRLRTEFGLEHDWAPISILHIVPTLRGEMHYSHFGGGSAPSLLGDLEEESKTEWFFSPSLGARFEPLDGLILRANGGRYNRTPNLSELFGDHGSTMGNPKLNEEVGWNADAGFTYVLVGKSHLDLLRVDAAWFGAWIDDLISFRQNSQSTSHPVNIDKATVQGAELSLRLQLFKWVKLSGNYTYFNGENRSDDSIYNKKKLPGRPEHEMYGRLELGRTFTKCGIGAWFDADYADKAYVGPYNNENAVTMHFLMGAGARFELPLLGFTFTFEAKNVTDNLVFKNENGDWMPMSDYDRYPLPGRTFLGTIHWRRP